MIDDRQLGRALRSWLDEEPAVLPVHVFDAILADVPRTHQRRARPWDRFAGRRTTRLMLVAAAVALALGVLGLAAAAGWLRPAAPPRPFPFGEVPLEPGTYVVDGAFPVRFSIDVPDGWAAIEREEGWVILGRDIPDGSTVAITTVDATTVDPCQPDLGVNEELGPTDRELAMALYSLPRLDGPPPSEVSVGGRPGWLVRLKAPTATQSCPEDPRRDSFELWALPVAVGVSRGGEIDVRIATVDGSRVVIASEHSERTTIRERAKVDAVIDTIRFAADSDVVPDASAVVIPTPFGVNPSDGDVLPLIATSGPVEPVPSARRVAVYGTGPNGLVVRLESIGTFVTQPPREWFGTEVGIVSSENPVHAAGIEVWSIASIYRDPCHWRTSRARVSNVDLDDLAEALAYAWAPADAAARPRAGPIRDPGWMGQRIRTITLAMDPDLDVARCDGGEARLWVDPEGRSRPVWPGMSLELYMLDSGGGDLALVRVAPKGMSESVRNALDEAWSSTSIIVWDANAP